MEHANFLNVYKGPDSLIKYFDPDYQPPLPLVEIPDKLNPFRADNVRVYAKMMTALPAQNVKALPALNMLQKGVNAKTETIVEQSSGSTVISLSILARVFHQISDVHAYMTNKIQFSRLQMLRFFGAKVVLFGGPSQPEAADPKGAIYKLQMLARESETVFNPGQYDSDANPEAHIRWTGPQILKQLPEINLFCCGMGTAGAITGIGTYLKQKKPSVFVIGVCNVTGDPIPGPRPVSLFENAKFPWKKVTDTVEEVDSARSYQLSMQLSREGLICGPSSGMALQGLFNVLQRYKDQGTLQDLAGDDGTASCVFLCCDLPFQYLNDYFTKLGEDHFLPIVNENLLNTDKYLYEEKWNLNFDIILELLYAKRSANVQLVRPSHQNATQGSELSYPESILEPNSVLLDLRSNSDFGAGHLPGAVNLPLLSLRKDTPGPFDDPDILEAQWKELDDKFCSNGPQMSFTEPHKRVAILCYQGDTARVASSILRAKKIEAYSVKGGTLGLHLFDGSESIGS